MFFTFSNLEKCVCVFFHCIIVRKICALKVSAVSGAPAKMLLQGRVDGLICVTAHVCKSLAVSPTTHKRVAVPKVPAISSLRDLSRELLLGYKSQCLARARPRGSTKGLAANTWRRQHSACCAFAFLLPAGARGRKKPPATCAQDSKPLRRMVKRISPQRRLATIHSGSSRTGQRVQRSMKIACPCALKCAGASYI